MNIAKNIALWFFFVCFQVIFLNQVHFMGFASPMLYLYFFLVYPYQKSNASALLLAFFSGMIIDAFSDTGGIFACATLVAVFVRPLLIKIFFGSNFEYQSVSLSQISFSSQLGYIFLFVLIHQFTFYFLEAFSFEYWQEILKKILISTLLTTFVCVLSAYFFSPQKK